MGKRKKSSRAPSAPKRKQTLATTFNCLFCSHENSVSVKIDKKAAVGSLTCKVCGQNWQTSTNYLSAPVDVYADWVDACELVNAPQQEAEERAKDRAFSSYATGASADTAGGAGAGAGRGGGGGGGGGGGDDDDDDEDDDDDY